MPLYEGDVSEYTAPPLSGITRLVVRIDAPSAGAELRLGVREVAADLDGELRVGSLLTLPPSDRAPADAVPPGSRTAADGDGDEEVGRALFAALFSGALSRVWASAVRRAQESGGMELVVESEDPQVNAQAWELLFDPVVLSGYVIMRDRWSLTRRRPRAKVLAGSPVPADELDVLVLTVAGSGYPVERDAEIIRSALPTATVEVVEAPSTQLALDVVRLRPFHVLHIVTSGAGQLTGDDLFAAARWPGRPLVTLLPCCESDALAAELAQRLPAVVGMRGRMSEAGSVAFLRGFYPALASGSPVGQAVGAGRAQQLSYSHSVGDEWARPVAYLQVRSQRAVEIASTPDPVPAMLAPDASVDLQLARMRAANLAAMRAQWEPDRGSVVPPFVRRQMERLAASAPPGSGGGAG